MPEDYCVILTTAGSEDEANRLAEMLVSRKLAACVQITGISSLYTWEGEMHREPEHLLLIKTAVQRYADVEAALVANHSYEVPEIVQLPIQRGLDRYLRWIDDNVAPEP